MTNVLDRAQSRRAELQAEMDRIDGFLAMYRELEGDDGDGDVRDDDQSSTDAEPIVTPISSAIPVPENPVSRRGPKGSNPEEIAAAAERLILSRGRPMTRYELVEAIEKDGLVVGGHDKARNIGTILWRSKAFENQGEGYWPSKGAGDPPPPAPEPDEFEL